jgi:hypothetical protein
VTVAPADVFAQLLPLLPYDAPSGPISVRDLVARWLGAGPRVFEGDDRAALDSLCRQIDVRKKLSVAYAPEWKPLDPEVPAEPPLVAGVIAVLLANARGVDLPDDAAALNDGWSLKCVNSALKALDLRDGLPLDGDLRLWAMEILDRVRRPALEHS